MGTGNYDNSIFIPPDEMDNDEGLDKESANDDEEEKKEEEKKKEEESDSESVLSNIGEFEHRPYYDQTQRAVVIWYLNSQYRVVDGNYVLPNEQGRDHFYIDIKSLGKQWITYKSIDTFLQQDIRTQQYFLYKDDGETIIDKKEIFYTVKAYDYENQWISFDSPRDEIDITTIKFIEITIGEDFATTKLTILFPLFVNVPEIHVTFMDIIWPVEDTKKVIYSVRCIELF